MKLKRINTIAAACLCSVVLLSGCSFSETVDNILGKTEKVVEDEFSSAPEKKDVMIVDPNMAKPSFSVNLEGSIQFAVGTEATPLTVEAAVSDGGTVTYQWYVNNVNSNGGGDKVAGATENTCVPETKEEGTWYYYVVATNTKDNHIAKSTSGTMEVSIVPEGNWVDENNLKKYQLFDGSFVTSAWKDIDGQRYAFDENGYMRTGWYRDADGACYYLNPDGTMARDVEIEGYPIDSEGKSEAKRQAEDLAAQQAAEQAAQQQAAEQPPAQ